MKVESLSNITTDELKNTFGVFKSKGIAEDKIKTFVKDNHLCFHINNFEKGQRLCFRHQIQKCNGACGNQEIPGDYNKRLNAAVNDLGSNPWPYENKIAIKEFDTLDPNKFEFHIVDKWCYLTSVKSLEDYVADSAIDSKIDIDTYNILSGFLTKKAESD